MDPEGLVPSDYASYQLFEPGDLVFKLIDLENISTSRVGHVPRRGIMSPAYLRLRPSDAIVVRYFYWQFFDLYNRRVFNQLGSGVRSTLGAEDVLDLPMIVPPVADQRAIADFLDAETARIDALIDRKRSLLELIKGRSLSLIDEVLLLGEPGKGRTYDSRLDGIWPELPSNWHITPLKYLATCDTSGAWGSEPGVEAEDVPVATTAQLDASGHFQHDKMEVRSFSASDAKRYTCRPGETVVVKSSGSATNIVSGKAGLVTAATPPFVFSNFLLRLRPHMGSIEPKYLYLLVTSHLVKERIKRMVSATTYPNLQVAEYLRQEFPVPPSSEQRAILERLEGKLGLHERAISSTEESITRMLARREAVITRAVSGAHDLAR